jgi:hypothetical protein
MERHESYAIAKPRHHSGRDTEGQSSVPPYLLHHRSDYVSLTTDPRPGVPLCRQVLMFYFGCSKGVGCYNPRRSLPVLFADHRNPRHEEVFARGQPPAIMSNPAGEGSVNEPVKLKGHLRASLLDRLMAFNVRRIRP